MGIGLVDPILPALASQLDASPSQVELLFRATSPSRASPCSSRALRFASGAIASFLAGKLAEGVSLEAPFLVGAGAVLLALATLLAGRRHLAAAE